MPQVPILPPMRGLDTLPEQQWRLGVAHVGELRLQGQPVAAGGGQPGDVRVGILVAALRHMQALQPVEIGDYRKHQCQHIPEQMQAAQAPVHAQSP